MGVVMGSAALHRMETRSPARSAILWTVAVGLSLGLNVVLFDLMPRLIDKRGSRRLECEPCIEMVNIVRIKHPEPRARREEKREEPKVNETPKKVSPKKMVYANRPVRQTMDLPFEINPKLPPVPCAVSVPPMKTVSLGAPDAPVLKGSYEMGEIDHPLTTLARVPPVYPMKARRMGIEGWVKVRFIVNEQGRVEDIRIVESRPEKVFDEAVIRCVSIWRFTPGTVDGIPVKTWVKTTVQFDLQKEKG